MKKNKKQKGGLLGAKIRFSKRMKMIAVAILACVAITCALVDPIQTTGIITLAGAPIALVAKMRKKAEDAGTPLSEEELAMLKLIEDAFTEYAAGNIDEDALNKTIDDLKGKIKAELSGQIDEMEETIKSINKEVKEMREKGFKLGGGSKLEKAVDAILDHPKVKEFMGGNLKKSGKIRLKDIISLTDDYSGNILISQQSDRLEDEVAERKVNLRDVMMVDQGDPAYPSITYAQVTNLNRNAAAVSENGRLPESSFKLREVADVTKRIGTYLPISKRLLKSRTYLRSYLMNRLPKWVRMAEDAQILFGDGQGENLNGIVKRCLNIVDWLTGNVIIGVVGDVASVDTYDDGAKTAITFNQGFAKIEEGQLITFTGAPAGSALLNANLLHKVNDRKVLLDVAYASLSAAQIAALAFTVKNNFYNQVDDPNLGDAIAAIFAILTYGEYSPNAIVLNPSTVFQIQTLKDSTGRNLDLIVDGKIAGRPIVESTAIAPGYFFAGDMQNGASLVDYSSLEVEFAEDVETKLTNSIAVIAQEEVILQVFNPFACAYGKLDDVLNAINKQ